MVTTIPHLQNSLETFRLMNNNILVFIPVQFLKQLQVCRFTTC
jgi:hypothetical protein